MRFNSFEAEIRYFITRLLLNMRFYISHKLELYTKGFADNKFSKYFNQTEILIPRQGLVTPGLTLL